MTSQVRLLPAILSAGIVLFGFGYLAVGRAGVVDAPAAAPAVRESTQALGSPDIAEVIVVAQRGAPPLTDATRS